MMILEKYKKNLKVKKKELKEFIDKRYGINVSRVKPVFIGFVGYGYIIHSYNKKYFAKIFPHSRLGRICAGRLDFSLDVTYNLHSKCGIEKISYPIPTKEGKLKSNFNNMPLVLFNFIEGKSKKYKKMDSEEISNLAKLIAKIHKFTSKIKTENSLIEDFTLDYKKDLLKSFKELENPKNMDDKYKEQLAKIILPMKEDILEVIKNLEKLSKRINKKDFVICHTDPIELNLIINKNKSVSIIDWDGVLIAPKEHDLCFYLHDQRFLNYYKREFGSFRLDKNAVLFYIKDRILEDLTDLLVRILHEDKGGKQSKEDLKDVLDNFIPYLKTMKEQEDKKSKIVDEWNRKYM